MTERIIFLGIQSVSNSITETDLSINSSTSRSSGSSNNRSSTLESTFSHMKDSVMDKFSAAKDRKQSILNEEKYLENRIQELKEEENDFEEVVSKIMSDPNLSSRYKNSLKKWVEAEEEFEVEEERFYSLLEKIVEEELQEVERLISTEEFREQTEKELEDIYKK